MGAEYLSRMTNMKRARVQWTGGGVVGASVSTFFFKTSVTDVAAKLKAFYTSLAGMQTDKVTWEIPSSGEVIDDATGDLISAWSETFETPVTGLNTGNFARGVGASIIWETLGTTNNRRVRGRTFMVPLSAAAFDTNGTLNVTAAGTLSSSAIALADLANSDMYVWTRPTDSTPGGVNSVTGVSIPDTTATLRSRRT